MTDTVVVTSQTPAFVNPDGRRDDSDLLSVLFYSLGTSNITVPYANDICISRQTQAGRLGLHELHTGL